MFVGFERVWKGFLGYFYLFFFKFGFIIMWYCGKRVGFGYGVERNF